MHTISRRCTGVPSRNACHADLDHGPVKLLAMLAQLLQEVLFHLRPVLHRHIGDLIWRIFEICHRFTRMHTHIHTEREGEGRREGRREGERAKGIRSVGGETA